MSRWIGRTSIPAVLLTAAIALAGCGSSKSTSNSGNSGNSGSSSSSTSGNSGNSGSSTSSTSGNRGSSTSGNSGSSTSGNTGNSGSGASNITDSTAVSDPAYLANIASRVEKSGVPHAKAQAVAQCIIQKFEAQGLKTSGDVNAAGQTAFEQKAYNPCAQANGVQ